MKKIIITLSIIILCLIIALTALLIKQYKISLLLQPYKFPTYGVDGSDTYPSAVESIAYLTTIEQNYSNLFDEYENIKKNESIVIKKIPRPESFTYFDWYKNNHANASVDVTEAILFEFPEIIKSLIETYGSTSLMDSAYWSDKGFFVYLINYGPGGHDGGKDIMQTSCIVQIAELDNSTPSVPDDWKVKPNQLFNFGDIRPPKKITNKNDTPEVR